MRAPIILALCLVVAAGAQDASSSVSKLACEESGYCSLGATKPYYGDIHNGKELREACEARSYKKEIILMAASGNYALAIIQATKNLEGLGLENTMVLGHGEEDCAPLAKVLPKYGCVWDSYRLPMIGKHVYRVAKAVPLWHNRWRVFARAVRIGYNVLSMDSDVIVYHDPYRFFKSPPFNEYVMFNQPEALYHLSQYHSVQNANGGIMYVQNASSTGPTAWLLSEVSDRNLRFIDSKFKELMKRGIRTSCDYMDQDCLNDVLSSVQSGQVIFKRALTECVHWDEDTGRTKSERQKWSHTLEPLTRHAVRNREVGLPPWMAEVAGRNRVVFRDFDMVMPHLMGGWNDTLGGNLYGQSSSTRGEESKKLMSQFQDDCPDCPLWPDPEDPSTLAAAKAVAKEKFLFAPPFLIFGYFPRGRLGFWHHEAFENRQPKQVIGHLHYIPGAGKTHAKAIARMSLGYFEFDIARELGYGGNTSVLDTALNVTLRVDSGEREWRDQVPKMVALHPDFPMDKLAGIRDYQELLVGLAHVALVTRRTIVYPPAPCHMMWITESTDSTGSPLHLPGGWFPHVPRIPSLAGSWYNNKSREVQETFVCTWYKNTGLPCFLNSFGILSMEFEQLVKWHHPRLNLLPDSSNTILKPDYELQSLLSEASYAGSIPVVSSAEVATAVAGTEDLPVVYVHHPVQVKEHYEWEPEYTARPFDQACWGLSRTHIFNMKKYAGKERDADVGVHRFGGQVVNGEVSLIPGRKELAPPKVNIRDQQY